MRLALVTVFFSLLAACPAKPRLLMQYAGEHAAAVCSDSERAKGAGGDRNRAC